MLRPNKIGDKRWGLSEVESKPRDLRDDRGYRVIVVSVSVKLSLNPHRFLKSKGCGTQKPTSDFGVRDAHSTL